MSATAHHSCVVCRTDYRDAPERIARRLLCERGYANACPRRPKAPTARSDGFQGRFRACVAPPSMRDGIPRRGLLRAVGTGSGG
jgi:hypothetical protein